MGGRVRSLVQLRRGGDLEGPGLLVELARAVRQGGRPDAAGVTELSATTGLPEASVRAASSWYADLSAAPAARVCRGTSCLLNGGPELETAVAAHGPCTGVYCLGYCDRSPAVLRADGRPVVACAAASAGDALAAAAPPEPGPCDVRCLAPEPLVTRRLGGDFAELEAARADGAYEGLRLALERGAAHVLDTIYASGERGRGGAAYPTGRKWRACAASPGDVKYAIANGDEGDPGSFIDRLLMERDPHGVLEGLAICAFACGASRGIVFIRSEYPGAIARMHRAIEQARDAGVLGPSVLGSDFAFDVDVFPGLGSYVCGEETAMLNAIEGFRGEVRVRPPYPSESGLYGRPTVVNNVETLVNVPRIIERGAEAYAALGTEGSSGTKAMCLNAGFGRPGVVEVEFGFSLRELIEEAAGGPRGGRLAAVILGGPMGSVLAPDEWDVPICYSAMGRRGVQLGHGGLVAVPEGADLRALLVHWIEFMVHESCGRCVPCRLGSRRALELARRDGGGDRGALDRLMEVMADASLCAFGQLMPRPMQRLLELAGGATT